jgi:tetratricopeptide (TPR) repeat protein
MNQAVTNRAFLWSFWCLLTVTGVALLLSACSGGQAGRIEQHKRLASELDNNGLHQAAIEEYEKVLGFDGLTDRQRGNINYLIGRLYFEDLKDYTNAAAYYIKAREYDPEGSFATEATRNLVASLEKLGNVLDARRQLGSATDIDHKPTDDDAVVARIGKRDIWLSEIEDQIQLLPPEYQSQLLGSQARIQYVHQYVGVELLYNAAIRENYLADPQVQRQQEQMVKRLVVDRFVADKVMTSSQIDSVDVRNFYGANRDSLYQGASFDSVRSRVYRDYQTQKAEVAYNEYIMNLAQAEQVEFLDHNVR